MGGAPEKITDADILQTLCEASEIVASSGEVANELPVVQKTIKKE